MYLKSIKAENIKGASFSHELTPACAIVGPNFTGKTAIIEAIRLALIGHIPEIGKLSKATWELSSGQKMYVNVLFDNDSAIRMSFWYDGNSVKAGREKEGLVNFEYLPLLNAEHYFRLTESERIAYVFSLIELPDSYTAKGIIAEVQRISLEEKHTEAIEEAKADCVKDLSGCFDHKGESIQDCLAAAVLLFREKFTYWNRRAKDTQGAVTTLAELKLREGEVSAASLKSLTDSLAVVQSELDRLNTEKGALVQKQDEASRIAERKKIIAGLLAAPRRLDFAALIAKHKAEIKKAKAEIVEVRDKGLLQERTKLSDKLADNAGTLKAAKNNIDSAGETLVELVGLESCPYCKSKGKGWKANLEKDLNAKIAHEQGVYDGCLRMDKETRVALTEVSKKIAKADQDQSNNRRLSIAIDLAEKDIERWTEQSEQEETRREELREELAALNILPDSEVNQKDLDRLTGEIVEALNRRTEFRKRQQVAQDLQQDLKRAAQSEIEHQQAKAHLVMVGKVGAVIAAKREGMIEEAFADLLTIANKVTRGILKTDLCLHEGTIGMWNGGKFVPHRVFSGTEKALAYIAIATALSSTSPFRLVILDEFTRLDTANQYKVAIRFLELVKAKVIDQFIIVGTSLPGLLRDKELSQIQLIKTK